MDKSMVKEKRRDKFLCQICIRKLSNTIKKYNYNELEVHHIVQIKEDYELRLQNSNLITTCESNRNANDELIRDRIGVKGKIALEWPPLTQGEISILLTAVSGVFFTVTYLDLKEGIVTKTMYVEDRTAPAYFYDTKTQGVKWSGLKMNFVEK